jgi:hypothetical protein
MALKTKKTNLASEYYIYYVCDKTVGDITSPNFEKALKRDLVKLGGVKKFEKIPSTTYRTQSGLAHKFRRSADGVVYCDVTGVVRGTNYSNTVVVDPPLGAAIVEITTSNAITRRVAGQVVEVPEKIGLHFTPSLNREQIGLWTQEVLVPAGKALAIKVGKDTELLALGAVKVAAKAKAAINDRKKNSRPRGKKGSKVAASKAKIAYDQKLAVTTYIPLGETTSNKSLTKAGGVNAGAGSKKKIIYGVVYEDSAVLMGLAKLDLTSKAEAEKGTVLARGITASSGSFKDFKVFAKLKRYANVWTTASKDNKDTKTSVTNSGTAITVKMRYTSNSVGSGNVIASNNQYAYMAVPSGTPVAFLMEALLQLPSRPRGFQISTGGTTYGKSYTLPQRNSKLRA